MKNKKLLLYIFIILMTILTAYIMSVMFVYFRYKYDDNDILEFNDKSDTFKVIDTLMINTTLLSDEEYITHDNMKIRNDFLEYEDVSNEEYARYSMDSNIVSFGEDFMNQKIDLYRSDVSVHNGFLKGDDFELVDGDELVEYLEKHNITNDIEFFEYMSNAKLYNLGILSSVGDIKENAILLTLSKMFVFNFDELYLIDGDYEGYIFKHDHYIECYIYVDNQSYLVSFVGEDFTKEYINDILNTLVIEVEHGN